jgi:glycyl-tRNA synthetase beta chain
MYSRGDRLNMKELLLEIGTEEIPAGFIPQALADLESLTRKELEAQRIDFEGLKTLGTPRRLVLVIASVAEQQKNVELRKVGPSMQAAFDAKGQPTQAALGFAKSQGVSVDSLKRVQTEKGAYVCAVKEEAGKPTPELLTSLLPKLILAIPFQKSMRWADLSIRFARPIHWILALFGGTVISFEMGNVRSGGITYGHRFMHPDPLRVDGFKTYLQETRKRFVMVDPAERRRKIEEEMLREAAASSGKVLKDEDLLNEVTFLVEYPVVLRGHFDQKFLSLPQDVLIHSMKEHQRYFPLVNAEGRLLPSFLCVSNIAPRDPNVVVKGNEKVLRARLSDAAYFFQEDLKVSLEKRVNALKKVVFQAKLGTSFEKMERFRHLALWITDRIDPGLRALVDRTAFLCKADLVTGMVGEFPKLQGVVGREYARLMGEKPEVSESIHEHYWPAFAGDRLPTRPIGAVVSMADRLDTIVGCFGVGLIPTGTADPFGLRRHALAILRIILEKKYSLSLVDLIEESEKLLKDKLERPASDVKQEVLDFFRTRYQYFLLDQGYAFDVIDAVFSADFDELLDVQGRVEALAEAKGWKDFESIVIASKRAINILKGVAPARNIDPTLFREPAEQSLYQAFVTTREKVETQLKKRDYRAALLEMTQLKQPVDEFFDRVMVMVDDPTLRENRLALLDQIGQVCGSIADFSKLT